MNIRKPAGRPTVGAQVKISFPPDMLTEIDTAAERVGLSRSAWIRQAARAQLDRDGAR